MKQEYKKQLWLLRGVYIASIVTVILLSAYSFLFLSPAYTKLIGKIAENEAIRVAHHLSLSLFKDNQPLSKEALPPNFQNSIIDDIKVFDLMKIKIFAPSGEIIFSTDEKDIGTINKRSYFHNIVKKGQPFTKIVEKNTKSLEQKIITIDVVETYVPLMNKDEFLGAFELYYDITDTIQKLSKLIFVANLIMMVIGFSLFMAMVFIVIKTKANMSARQTAEEEVVKQSHTLATQNEDLALINSVADVISKSIDLDKLLHGALKVITSQFTGLDVTRGGIMLVQGDKLVLAAHLGHDKEFLKQHENLSVGQCLCGTAAQTGEIILSGNSSNDPNHTLCKNSHSHGHIIVPLQSHDEIIGILYLYTPPDLKLLDKEGMLHTIGSQIGLAISNIELFMETKRKSLYDQLTGLANRHNLTHHFSRFISEAKRYKTPLSLAMMDIDFFKKYNDTHGHLAGDQILAKVSAIIKDEIRNIDFPARYGGEEFIIILPKTTKEDAKTICERVRTAIESQTDVTISGGISQFRPEISETELINEADTALYQAKSNNRNRIELATEP